MNTVETCHVDEPIPSVILQTLIIFLMHFLSASATKIEYHSEGVEDFALHLPSSLVPSKRVLLLRYKNRFEALAQSLHMRGVTVTSAYPVTWMRREWSAQEERAAREVDGKSVTSTSCSCASSSLSAVSAAGRIYLMFILYSLHFRHQMIAVVYLHENHAVSEWASRIDVSEAERRGLGAVAACHDEGVARAAKAAGFREVFYAKKSDTVGLTNTVLEAVEFARSANRMHSK